MKQYGVMLVGCGTVAEYGHLPAIDEHKHARLVAVADRAPERAAEAAARFGAEAWSDNYRTLLAREDIDLVVIATPPSTHAKIIIESLETGRHVLCEKPLTSNLIDARRVMDAVQKSAKHLMVGYILRHNEVHKKARELIDEGLLGFPLAMRLMGAEHYEHKGQWERALRILKDTSPLIDCGCHYVDLMRWFTGSEAVSVSGIKQRLHADVPADNYDYALIAVQMQDGSVGIYEVGWGHNMKAFSTKQIIGPRGRIDILYSSTEEGKERISLEYYSYPEGVKFYQKDVAIKQMNRQFATFLERIENAVDPLPELEDAFKSLEIVLAGHKAITEGTIVRIAEPT